ncbi:MAG: 4Fe-4S binding protein [Candidatus Methanoplasma sp.]|nr:4Fe-4S binding protein [Candidatus Methanoplasma sp.]
MVSGNAGWRIRRPSIDPGLCVGCGACALHCPDGALSAAGGAVETDYDFCKGCGICARVCGRGAISMEAER